MNDFEEENTDTQPESIDERIDPRLRPADPAGTRPRFIPDQLLPESNEPLLHTAVPADVDAEGVEVPLDGGELLPQRLGASAPELAAAPGGPTAHAGRFGFMLGALLAIGVAGVIVAALVYSHRNDKPVFHHSTWSSWQPVEGEGSAMAQIASHVGPLYRLPTGRQLLSVTSSTLKVQGVNLDIATIGATNKSDIKITSGKKSVMYRMCGFSPAGSCAIPGTPSVNRAALVNREALELALYTFEFTDANGVVVVFPPTYPSLKNGKPDLKKPAKVATYFQRKQLSSRLSAPLADTLSPNPPSVADALKSPDAVTVKSVTAGSTYGFSLTAGNTEDKGYLVLQK